MSLRLCTKIMVEARTKELAYSLCRKYLGGDWARVSFTNFQIERIEKFHDTRKENEKEPTKNLAVSKLGGLTNHLFLCSLPSDMRKDTVSVKKVLLRLYGATYSEMSERRFRMLEECLICGLLAEKSIGPSLYGIFPEGRLEQYIPHMKSLTNVEIRQEQISKRIAENVASFHKLTLPLSKEANWHWSSAQKFIAEIKEMSFSDPLKTAKLNKILKKFDLENELKFLRVLAENSNSPVVFCHNDVQPGNLLVKKSSTLENAEIYLIDFEYSCYNHRGSDIGNHFAEWTNDYNYPHYPYFKGNRDDYPSHSQKAHFVRSYLQAFHEKNVSDEEVEKVIVEADRLSLVSHFFWALMSIIQESKSTIKFGYLDYAMWRLECYEHFKYFAQEDDFRDGSLRNRIIGLKT